jgi:hypothetical protein
MAQLKSGSTVGGSGIVTKNDNQALHDTDALRLSGTTVYLYKGNGTNESVTLPSAATILSSPALTGTPTAPTASSSTNTTQIATTAFVQSLISSAISSAVASTKEALYPVGSIYTNATSTANPATLLGFGTWVEFGSGRVLVGQNTGDASFNSLQETGGSKNAVVVSHTHTATVNDSGHAHTLNGITSRQDTWNESLGSGRVAGENTGGVAAYGGLVNNATTGITVTNSSTGESGTNKNLQPYIVVKMWKRTA